MIGANYPYTDFSVNANGTLILLENARLKSPGAAFIFCSTNKVVWRQSKPIAPD